MGAFEEGMENVGAPGSLNPGVLKNCFAASKPETDSWHSLMKTGGVKGVGRGKSQS